MNDLVDWLREQYELKLRRQRETKLFYSVVAIGTVNIVLLALIAMGKL